MCVVHVDSEACLLHFVKIKVQINDNVTVTILKEHSADFKHTGQLMHHGEN